MPEFQSDEEGEAESEAGRHGVDSFSSVSQDVQGFGATGKRGGGKQGLQGS